MSCPDLLTGLQGTYLLSFGTISSSENQLGANVYGRKDIIQLEFALQPSSLTLTRGTSTRPATRRKLKVESPERLGYNKAEFQIRHRFPGTTSRSNRKGTKGRILQADLRLVIDQPALRTERVGFGKVLLVMV